ncbi:MAG: methionyl-tRNA formyltransferase [bacterium]|nr:methionyl-tRNA formyltransferase [bacterium]
MIDKQKNSRLVFFGTSNFAVPVLRALVENNWLIAGVVTQPDKPAKRGLKMEASPVKKVAQELKLKIIQPENLNKPEIAEELKHLKAKVGVLVSFGKIVSQCIIDIFPRGILNLHPSLLPKYRGPSPIQAAILNGDEETGVSVMLLDAKMDHGNIIESQKSIRRPADKNQNYFELEKELAKNGAELLKEVLPRWLEGKIKPQEQDDNAATYTKIIKKEDGRIDWRKSAEEIERRIRAFNPWPGTWTMWQGKRLKILQAGVVKSPSELALVPGSIVRAKNGPIRVICGQNGLELIHVQLEGKKAVSAQEFVRGYQGFIGSRLA